MRIGIDTGGTFTDCVYLDHGKLRILKVFSTPRDAGLAVQEAVQSIAGGSPSQVRHGTTVGTNALLERKGARVSFVTTAGFEDAIAIGRQARTSLYDWFAEPPPCLVPADLRFGVAERVAADGSVLLAPDPQQLTRLRDAIQSARAEAIAVSLLFSFVNPRHEQLIEEALRPLQLPISLSHRILPEFREYERSATIVVNAYLAPRVGAYLGRLDRSLASSAGGGSLDVMQSSGGIVPAAFAAEQPVRTVLSGPAGGVMGAYFAAQRAGFRKVITFDMGGTSTDVSLIDMDSGPPSTSNESIVAGLPIAVPTLDIHTVGAGGGSLAVIDEGGLLRVGPDSAGADPGPICYGRGSRPTVSDANLLLGRLDPDHFLGRAMRLDEDRTRLQMELARGPFATVEEFAAGIVKVAETHMAQALRVISIERGLDPREFTLVAFGGAGPLHACALAEELAISRVLVPPLPGALSALGILLADQVRDYSRTVMTGTSTDLESVFEELQKAAGPGTYTRSLDLRYTGQGYELNVAAGAGFVDRFHAAHQRRYGYSDVQRHVEVVTARLRVTNAPPPVEWRSYPSRPGNGSEALLRTKSVYFESIPLASRLYDRARLQPGDRFAGPAIVVEYSATTVLPPNWTLSVDSYENLVLERSA